MTYASDVFSKRLKEVRVKMGLTQAQFAERVGISRATVGFYENAERVPDINVLSQIAENTEVSVNYYLGFSEAMNEYYDDLSFVSGLDDDAISGLMSLDTSAISALLKHPEFQKMVDYIALFTSPVLHPDVTDRTLKTAKAYAHICLSEIIETSTNTDKNTTDDTTVKRDDYSGLGRTMATMLAFDEEMLEEVYRLSDVERNWLEMQRKKIAKYPQFSLETKRNMMKALHESSKIDQDRIFALEKRIEAYQSAIDMLFEEIKEAESGND